MDLAIIKDLYKLFTEQTDCDVTFNVKEEDIQAHKLIISMRSEVLKTMINNKLSYENGKIMIKDPDVSADDFRQFLQYLYTDDCQVSKTNVPVLLHLGHMYVLPSLLEKCAAYIQQNLDLDTAICCAEIGLLYADDCSLLQKCLKYISEKRVLANEDSLFDGKASAELVQKIAERCERTISLTEDHIFNAIFKWTEYECFVKEVETNPTNRKAAINHVLPFIKFDSLKSITLATKVTENKLLEDAEIFECLRKSVINEYNAIHRVTEMQQVLNRKRKQNREYQFVQLPTGTYVIRES